MCGAEQRNTPQLSTPKMLRLIDALADAGALLFSFTGGEPFVREDLETLVDRCRARGCAVTVNSSGYFPHGNLAVLPKLRTLCLSLDGPEELNDRIRYAGAFRHTLEGLDACRTHGLRARLTCTVNRLNTDCLPRVAAIAAEKRVPILFQPGGPERLRGSGDNPLALDETALRRAMATLAELKRHNRFIANSHKALKLWAGGQSGSAAPCLGGALFCKIDAAGRISGCSWSPQGEPTPIGSEGLQRAFQQIAQAHCTTCYCASRMELNLSVAGLWELPWRLLGMGPAR